MADTLNGKTALVTGASRGIGAAIARALAADGALVAVHYGAQREAAESVVREIESVGGQAFALGADLGVHDQIAGLFERLDRELTARTGGTGLDILINNAGRGAGGGLMQTTEADFDAVIGLNLKGLFFVTQFAGPRLRDEGRIINITSASARGAAAPRAIYSASKYAANGLTLSMAQEFAPRRITVNALAPGAVATDLINEARKDPAFERGVIAMTAFRRLGEPEDIAGVVRLLVSPEAGWITGQVIEASGGLRL
jgi:NAD(P)-dependent dehydrogenase (short-subunit alcohol dehydrogenase family)